MKRRWLVITTLVFIGVLFWFYHKEKKPDPVLHSRPDFVLSPKEVLWRAPDTLVIPLDNTGDLIRYGHKLIRSTAKYFGPRGSIGQDANGMNCQNCHLDAGTKAWAGNFGAVAAVYPHFSARRGAVETIHQRISDCFERSMNGSAPDSNSYEMQAMKAYILWLGKDVPKGERPTGTGLELPAYLERAADPIRGKMLYMQKCQRCHGTNGDGQKDSSAEYLYPPLWGENSYNTAAGLYRLSKFAGFIKDNMPLGSNYANELLSTEEAWDLAAFVNSQPRPVKKFKQDWPNILLKPVDLPEGPFPDSYPVRQHKYGPFKPIASYKKAMAAK